jgi:hypothetical protein
MTTVKKLPLLVLFSLAALFVNAQNYKQATKKLDASQKDFTKMLSSYPMTKSGKDELNNFITNSIDSLQKLIRDNDKIPAELKLQAINCQCYLLDTLRAQVANKTFDIGLIRDSRQNFIPLWENMVNEKSNDEIMKNFDLPSANLMSVVFRDFPQSARMKDIVALKQLERAPENIMVFLDKNPVFELRDSLIIMAADMQPEKLAFYIQNSRNDVLQKAIRDNKAPLAQTLVRIAGERNVKNYYPFLVQIANNKMTLADVDRLRTQPVQYYQTMVDQAIANQALRQSGGTPVYVRPTRQYVKEYGTMFYTDVINSLHESPEKVRFEALDELRPQDLYYLITNGETELYTSSYLYTYKKLMKAFEKTTSDQLLELVHYDQFRKFLLMAGRYNTISTFISQMPKDKGIQIMKRLMGGLEEHTSDGLEETINVAETFPGIVKDLNLSALTSQEIKNNYNRCQAMPSLYGMKIYKLLSEMFKAVRSGQIDNGKSLPAALQVYYKIPFDRLKSADGSITQLVLFYGDDDGKASYSSFLSNFGDASQWSIEKNESWITIKSKKLHPVTIYANLPLANEDGLDVKAQDALAVYLKGKGISPHILIHRGHSYHLMNSIKFVTADTRLAIVGSCGGYREIFEILDKSPDAQVISTKQIGSLQVNEPILKQMNERLLNEKDVEWSDMWTILEKQFKNNKTASDYFTEYVPPYKNIALLVATLYNQSGID